MRKYLVLSLILGMFVSAQSALASTDIFYPFTVFGKNFGGQYVAQDFDYQGNALGPPVPVDVDSNYEIMDVSTIDNSSTSSGTPPTGANIAISYQVSGVATDYDEIKVLTRTSSGWDEVPGKIFKIPSNKRLIGLYARSDHEFESCVHTFPLHPTIFDSCVLNNITENTPGAHDPSQDATVERIDNFLTNNYLVRISELVPTLFRYSYPTGGGTYFSSGMIITSTFVSGIGLPVSLPYSPRIGLTTVPDTGFPNYLYRTSGLGLNPAVVPIRTLFDFRTWQSYSFMDQNIVGQTSVVRFGSGKWCAAYERLPRPLGSSTWVALAFSCLAPKIIREGSPAAFAVERSSPAVGEFVSENYVELSSDVNNYLNTLSELVDVTTTKIHTQFTGAFRCDLNGGGVSITDALIIAQIAVGLPFDFTPSAWNDVLRYCDSPLLSGASPTGAECNGVINVNDALWVAQLALMPVPAIAPECPTTLPATLYTPPPAPSKKRIRTPTAPSKKRLAPLTLLLLT